MFSNWFSKCLYREAVLMLFDRYFGREFAFLTGRRNFDNKNDYRGKTICFRNKCLIEKLFCSSISTKWVYLQGSTMNLKFWPMLNDPPRHGRTLGAPAGRKPGSTILEKKSAYYLDHRSTSVQCGSLKSKNFVFWNTLSYTPYLGWRSNTYIPKKCPPWLLTF